MTTKFVFLLQSNIYHQNTALAYEIACEVLNQQHQIEAVFLLQDGTTIANANLQPVPDLQTKWQKLLQAHKIPAFCCITSAVQRGILNQTEANLHHKQNTILEPFEFSSLMKMHQLITESDKTIQL
jgi:tRNA 2-thiouridine synthesizing protein D